MDSSRRNGQVNGTTQADFKRWFKDAVEKAVEWNQKHCKVKEGEKSHTPCWHLVRLMRGHPELSTANVALFKIECVINQWQRKHGFDFWREYFGISKEDAEVEIKDAWSQVRLPPGTKALEHALELHRRRPLSVNEDRCKNWSQGYQEFVSICGWLSMVRKNHIILAPVETFGKILGVTPMTVSRYRNWAVNDHFMEQTKRYKFRAEGEKDQATEFQFHWEKFEELRAYRDPGSERHLDDHDDDRHSGSGDFERLQRLFSSGYQNDPDDDFEDDYEDSGDFEPE